jgi:hypothetical protein
LLSSPPTSRSAKAKRRVQTSKGKEQKKLYGWTEVNRRWHKRRCRYERQTQASVRAGKKNADSYNSFVSIKVNKHGSEVKTNMIGNEEYDNKMKGACYICKKTAAALDAEANANKMTIDQLVPGILYTTANTRSCCWYCNRGKNTLSLSDFQAHVLVMNEHMDEAR